jgi:hypothetical protein
VLFGHIAQDPQVTTAREDLSRLKLLASYFSVMRQKLRLLSALSCRLEHTAETFYNLALSHIQDAEVPAGSEGDNGEVSADEHGNISRSHVPGPIRPAQDLHAELFRPENSPSLSRFPTHEPNTDGGILNGPEMGRADPFQAEIETWSTGMKRPFETAFDWFSWDAYYSRTMGMPDVTL